MRVVLGAVARVSQTAAGVSAAWLFRHPPRFFPTPSERRALGRAEAIRVRTPWGELGVWQWGRGPQVLLVHGWGSHAGRLTRFVPELVASGFGVTAFDAPGHGVSEGRFVSLPEFIGALRSVVRLVSPVALIGHSLGAAACAHALASGSAARAAVLLAAPADPGSYARRFGRYVRIPRPATEALERCLESRYGRLSDLSLPARRPGVPVLLFHDRGDTRVPLRNGLALSQAWPKSRIVVTRGLGHHRILRNADVVRRAVRFLAETVLGTSLGARAMLAQKAS